MRRRRQSPLGRTIPHKDPGRPRETSDASSSSLLDDLGRVRRVKAKLADASRFASLDTAATAKGGQLRGGRGGAGHGAAPNRARSAHDRRAISVPLARVTRGQPRSLGTARYAWSAPLAAVTAALPKLIVRVRFSSPAPRTPAHGALLGLVASSVQDIVRTPCN